ncbi:MAG TPA: phosphotransferase [Pyrinomonadaceae bacterium]|nr:phosphotransferase [Pyrinomonadaceae bacterium]
MVSGFSASPIQRLHQFLKDNQQIEAVQPLTPDASTREYFRINWNDKSAIACVYPEPFDALENSYLDVTTLFQAGGLPVAEIYTVDDDAGIIIQEDFGDLILRNALREALPDERENLINKAIRLIPKIQAATKKAFELNSIASRLKFDEEKLLWELNFFKTHYFETLRKVKLPETEDKLLSAEFTELSRELERHAKVLCHRDFHAANLMIDDENRLRIIDHQDARIGSVAYDLVSLLLDRIHEPPPNDWLKEKKYFFLAERESLGLEEIDEADFDYEFDLMTVQRCLKAIGTFSFQSVNRGKTHYVQFIEPMFEVVLNSCRKLDRFPNLQQIIGNTALTDILMQGH